MRKIFFFTFSTPAVVTLLFSCFLLLGKTGNAQNLLLNGDFESGGAGTGFNTNYFIVSTPGTSVPREYNILTNPFDMNNTFFANAADHTFGNGTGRMMVVDGSGNPGDKVWELLNGGSIGIQSGRTYIFSYWIRSVSASNDASNSAIIKIYTNGTTSAPVLIAGSQTCPTGNPSPWVQVTYTWTATTNNAQIWLTDEQTSGGGAGNDFALDDITLVEDNGPLSLRYCSNGPACPGNSNGVIASWGRGGVPPYFFSLNNGAFQPISIFPVIAPSAGNQLRIIDSKTPVPDTAYSSPFTIDIPNAVNLLNTNNDTSICNTETVNLTATGGTNYVWSANTAPTVANLSSTTGASVTAAPTTTTTYTVTADVASVNLISNPGFENGDSGFYSDYKFYAATNNQQAYGIVTNAQLFNTSLSACTAHNPGGKMMVVDGATSIKQVWSQVVSVTPNTNYTFSFYIQTLALPVPAQLNVSINGQILGVAVAPATTCGWVQYSYTWNSGFLPLAYIDLINITTAVNGNDFALDDLLFTTECTNLQKSVTVTVGNLSAPDISITQPTCTTPTGQVTVTNPNSGVSYSFDNGVSFQASATSPPLAPNTTYLVKVQNNAGCISLATAAVITTVPSVPPAPTVVTQTNCTTPVTGTITITSPLGANYEYSKDGVNYQSSPSFTGLAPSTYSITYKDNNTSCISSGIQVTVSTVTPGPQIPLLSITQPSCAVPTGSVTITAPLGTNYVYSKDVINYQTSPTFSGLFQNTYSITVKDTSSGCISAAAQATINAVPPSPQAPVFTTVTNLDCANSTVSVTITSPLGITFLYSKDGIIFQASTLFDSLPAGNYNFTVKDIVTGCISAAAGFIYTGGNNTAPPLVTDTIRYCQGAAASTLTATGQNLQWYNAPTGGTSLPGAPLPTTASISSTTYYVTQTLFACESVRVPITVIVSAVPVAPSVTTPVAYCQGTSATTLSPSGNNYLWFTTSTGGSGVTTIIPSTSTAGSTNYFVSETNNGCEGPRAQVVVQVNATPVLGNDKVKNICNGETVNLTTEFNTSGFTTAYFINGNAVTNPSAIIDNGEYLVTASSGLGCTDSAVLLLIVRPPVSVSAGNDFTTAAGLPILLTAQGGGGVGAFFQWTVLQPSAGVVFSNPFIGNPTATFSEGISTLQVRIMDDIGCIGYDTIVVTANKLWSQIYIPNAFSPNSDAGQLNETFKPSAQSIASIKYFRVFNRYGQVIFETNIIGKGWDGTYLGKQQPTGNYIWVLRCINALGKEVNMKGNVMLIR